MKEDASLLAVPILVAVSLCLCWCLVRLPLNALPLSAGVATMLLPHRAGIATGSAVVSGAALALTIAVAGKSLATRAPLPMVRAAGLFAFTATASFAAWHAVTSLTALLIGASAWRTIRALLAAFLVGAASWREVAGGADRRTAG